MSKITANCTTKHHGTICYKILGYKTSSYCSKPESDNRFAFQRERRHLFRAQEINRNDSKTVHLQDNSPTRLPTELKTVHRHIRFMLNDLQSA